MKRRFLALTCIALPGLLGSAWMMKEHNPAPDVYFEPSTWSPTIREIQETLVKQGENVPEHERHQQFCEMVKSRFRKHEPQVPIGLRFLDGKTIKLMCPARMEPWNIDRIAMTVWREANSTFRQTFDIELCATFFGASVKIGELRPVPENPGMARIVYNYSSFQYSHP